MQYRGVLKLSWINGTHLFLGIKVDANIWPLNGTHLKVASLGKDLFQLMKGPLSNPWVVKWDPCLGGDEYGCKCSYGDFR